MEVDDLGALVRFNMTSSKARILALVSLLSEKYGRPVAAKSEVANRLGTKFEKQTFSWMDDRGTKLEVDSIYGRIDQGRVVIESASYQKARRALKDLAREAGKSKL